MQIKFGPLRCHGIGLSDGEGIERLWSYLRRFSAMTKEMRPAHRKDILAHALVYYGIQKKQKLGELLCFEVCLFKDNLLATFSSSQALCVMGNFKALKKGCLLALLTTLSFQWGWYRPQL